MLAHLLMIVGLAQAPAAPGPPPRDQPADTFRPDPAWKTLGTSLWFDPANKALVIRARVVLREGYLEHLLCLDQTKEHESILATPAPPRMIHAGLLLTGAEVGRPVQYEPEFKPPSGTPIRIELEWTDADGRTRRAPARDWVRDEKSRKPLAQDWVFAGSQMFEDKKENRTLYAADGGDLITVANFMSAILDLPLPARTTTWSDRSWRTPKRSLPSGLTSR
jgi:hypothetical protein